MDQIVIESYDEKTGISRVKLNTKYGTFDHSVRVAEEDKDIENRHDGVKFALYKCQIDATRAKGRALRERAKGMDHAANVLINAANDPALRYWKYTGDSVMLVRVQAEIFYDEARQLFKEADDMKKDYLTMVASTLNTRRAFRKRGEKKEEDGE